MSNPRPDTTSPSTLAPSRALVAAAALGLLGVAAGAFGAHGLETRVSPEQLEWWATGARYQQIHAVALAVVAWGQGPWSRWRSAAALAFVVGVVIFAGTLYAMALGGPRILGAVTPIGGLSLMIGWAAVAGHAWAELKRRA